MKIEQLYTGCLAQGAYYIESNGEAAIIDPLREVQPYIDMAERRSANIKYIFETHFHADFVSGHITLAEKTGAAIVFGPNAETSFDALIATDGQLFKLGDIQIKVLHTPGHTMESTTYLVLDKDGKEHAIFSGDTLFLGDVGRPDLAQKAADMTQEELAGTLYDSLRQKIMTLPDDVIVYPGHGAGSACGKNMSSETIGSIGHEKAHNYALQPDMSKAAFVEAVTDGLLPPPAYFPLNVQLNKEGYQNVDEVIARGESALDPDKFEAVANTSGAVVLDVRHQDAFAESHIPGSIFIGIDGSFAPWVGALIQDIQQPILLVAAPDRIKETITRLSRVGFDNVLGYLDGGLEAWQKAGKETDSLAQFSADEVAEAIAQKQAKIIDVRKKGEYEAEHIEDALLAPLDYLNDHMKTIKEVEAPAYLHCKSGYRSVIALSILKSRGIHHIGNIAGGFDALKKTSAPTTDYVCPSTLK